MGEQNNYQLSVLVVFLLSQTLIRLQTIFGVVGATTLTRIVTKKAEGVTDANQVNSMRVYQLCEGV